MCLFGGASGQVEPFDPQQLNSLGSLFLTRPTLAHYTATPEERSWRWEELTSAVLSGELDVHIGAEIPLDHAPEAHAAIESGTTTGKILLEVNPSL